MADPISIIGAVVAAIQTMKSLVKTIDALREGPGSLRDIRSDLSALAQILQKLEKTNTEDSNDGFLFKEVGSAVQGCDSARKIFMGQLQHWTRHSNNKAGAWADGLKVPVFIQGRIEVLRAQLRDCKSTLNVALSTATLYVSTVGAGTSRFLFHFTANLLIVSQWLKMKTIQMKKP